MMPDAPPEALVDRGMSVPRVPRIPLELLG